MKPFTTLCQPKSHSHSPWIVEDPADWRDSRSLPCPQSGPVRVATAAAAGCFHTSWDDLDKSCYHDLSCMCVRDLQVQDIMLCRERTGSTWFNHFQSWFAFTRTQSIFRGILYFGRTLHLWRIFQIPDPPLDSANCGPMQCTKWNLDHHRPSFKDVTLLASYWVWHQFVSLSYGCTEETKAGTPFIARLI